MLYMYRYLSWQKDTAHAASHNFIIEHNKISNIKKEYNILQTMSSNSDKCCKKVDLKLIYKRCARLKPDALKL